MSAERDQNFNASRCRGVRGGSRPAYKFLYSEDFCSRSALPVLAGLPSPAELICLAQASSSNRLTGPVEDLYFRMSQSRSLFLLKTSRDEQGKRLLACSRPESDGWRMKQRSEIPRNEANRETAGHHRSGSFSF
jgi:hypothetical protein